MDSEELRRWTVDKVLIHPPSENILVYRPYILLVIDHSEMLYHYIRNGVPQWANLVDEEVT